ncbi:tetratricopeptide repeat protein [Edaphobacter bradus]|uniref:tetratricopeptide repeat protein n=1 Tax=Edaphobacter bradus TaxID=2259016 RepID=UPI0021DFACB9|nr:tetratricopeptide repeat protein [Edaphobacter bradus]
MRCLGTGGWWAGLRSIPVVAAAVLGMMVVLTVVMGRPSRGMAGGDDPDRRCAACHADIYASWEETTMARGSGWAMDGLIRGSFFHERSKVNYQLDSKDGEARLRYERDRPASGQALRGEERLVYYIGSGRRGRTYLFARPLEGGNLWFEAPVNWYSRRSKYDMAPAYENAERAPLALQVEPNCLHCHATGVAEPLPFARNAWAGAPFRQGGVGCAACHGDAEAHVASGGRKPMLRLGTLTPQQQDSVCLQCHLEGDVMIQRAGRSLRSFEPGQDLSETAVYFVNASSATSALRASSQYEALLRSACRRAVGARMTCTTCHDPHSLPPAAERVAYFRARCLQCHTAPGFDAKGHHPEKPDCVACHMPTRDTADISHEQLTDHDIEARPRAKTKAVTQTASDGVARFTGAVNLVAVGEGAAGDRERGLAYTQFAERDDRLSYMRAKSLLEKVEFFGHADAVVHEELGYLAQIGGDRTKAQAEYRVTLAMDPHDATALTDLAVLEAQSGAVADAEALLKEVTEHNPGQTAAVLSLAALRCAEGGGAAARELVQLALKYNPDDAAARRFEETGEYGGMHCRLR